MRFILKPCCFWVSLGMVVLASCLPSRSMSEPGVGDQTADHRLDLNSCHPPNVNGEARCGAYEVYENRATQSGRKISLKIVVLPALGPNPARDREKLEKQADLRLYTTPIAVDDLDEVRKALGYGKIDIVAGSYGTIPAQVYMRQHPDSARAVFLIGVATPAIKQPLLFPRAAQHALDLLFVDCTADQACSSAFPNLKSEFYQVLSRFDRGPLEVRMIAPTTKKVQTVRLERENYVERIRFLLYTSVFARFVPLVAHKAYEGDFLPFEEISIAYNPGGLLSRGMYFTVTCSEGVPFITHREMIVETRGTFVGEARIRAHIEACKEWPRGDVPRSFIDPIKSDLPVVMVSGEVDGSSPLWFGKDAVKYLPNGRQIPIRYYGHDVYSPRVWGIMRDFIQSASVRGLDTSCTAEIRRPSFATEIPAAMAIQ